MPDIDPANDASHTAHDPVQDAPDAASKPVDNPTEAQVAKDNPHAASDDGIVVHDPAEAQREAEAHADHNESPKMEELENKTNDPEVGQSQVQYSRLRHPYVDTGYPKTDEN